MVRVVLALILAALVLARPARALEITDCDTIVPDNETGFLRADLSCAGAFIGVRLMERATLRMEGHRIIGTFTPDPPRAVECAGKRCKIVGPGEIAGGDFVGVTIGMFTPDTRLDITDVNIHDCREGIVGKYGFSIKSRVRALRVRTSNTAGAGIWADDIRAVDVHANGNRGVGLTGRRMRAIDVEASNNRASGIFGDRFWAKGLRANANGDCGVRTLTAALRNATLTGNHGFGEGIDLATAFRPRVVATTCGKSAVIGAVQGSNWGVCADD